jgi:hypothetical protein
MRTPFPKGLTPTLLLALTLFSAGNAHAHDDHAHDNHAPPENTPLTLSLFADIRQAWRDESPLAFAVPGFMPGGDIGPDARGLSLAHAGMLLAARHEQLAAALEINAHAHHGGDNTLMLEQAWIRQTHGSIAVTAGRQFASIGLRNHAHGASAAFPDAGLTYRVFLGDHYIDDGVALAWDGQRAFSAGVAAWQGTFPGGGIGNDGNGAWSLHLDARAKPSADIRVQARLSLLAAKASLRYDERFEPGHSHNPFVTAPTLTYFSGDSTLGIASLQLDAGHLQLLGEFFLREEDGQVRNLTQQAAYSGEHTGVSTEALWFSEPGKRQPGWHLGMRYSTLAASNALTGPGAATLATQSGALAAGQPAEVSLVLGWHPDSRQVLRLQVSEGGDYSGGDAVLLQYAVQWDALN